MESLYTIPAFERDIRIDYIINIVPVRIGKCSYIYGVIETTMARPSQLQSYYVTIFWHRFIFICHVLFSYFRGILKFLFVTQTGYEKVSRRESQTSLSCTNRDKTNKNYIQDCCKLLTNFIISIFKIATVIQTWIWREDIYAIKFI